MATEEVTTDNVLDSRTINDRVADLRTQREGNDWDDELSEELEALEAVAEDGENLEDWEYGVTLIRDSYFVTYAQEFAEDIGAIDSEARWPAYCIDWERAAGELQIDYTPVEFAGVTYWAR